MANVMDIREIYAEKFRAMNERARYRDFYDFYVITQEYHLDFEQIISLLRQKEVRKQISKASMLRNWKIASESFRDEINLVYYQDPVYRDEKKLEDFLNGIEFDPISPS